MIKKNIDVIIVTVLLLAVLIATLCVIPAILNDRNDTEVNTVSALATEEAVVVSDDVMLEQCLEEIAEQFVDDENTITVQHVITPLSAEIRNAYRAKQECFLGVIDDVAADDTNADTAANVENYANESVQDNEDQTWSVEDSCSTEQDVYDENNEQSSSDESSEDESSESAALKIWRRLKGFGWSDVVCAGIMGNIMAEVGGQSFEIAYWLDVNGYYGMCMWNKGYNPGVVGKDLDGQCDYLYDTIEGQFKSYGLPYDSFLSLEDPGEAAIQFARAYERCTKASYNIRAVNAAAAYSAFAG